MKANADTAVAVVCGLALLAAMTVAQAQGLADPTRPPPSIEKPPAADAKAPGEAAPPPGLQTVILRAGAKPAAIVNGEYVALGGKVGEARVVAIAEDSVTLKSATGKETLKLTPGIEKQPATKAETAPVKASGKRTVRRKADP